MKYFLIAVFALFSLPALAAGDCSLKWTLAVTLDGVTKAENVRNLYGLTSDQLKRVQARGKRAFDVGSKQQDKGGGYVVALGEEASCAGAPATVLPTVELKGMTARGVNAFLRTAAKGDSEFLDDADKRVAAGKKSSWGE